MIQKLTEREADDMRGALQEARDLAAGLRDVGHDIATRIVEALDILDAHCLGCGEPHVSHERTPADRFCGECRIASTTGDPF